MKRAILMIVCLCMMCSAAFAEETIELNWEQIGTEEVAAQGEFQALEIPDVCTVNFWIPSVLNAVDTSVIEGPFKPTALEISDRCGKRIIDRECPSRKREPRRTQMA